MPVMVHHSTPSEPGRARAYVFERLVDILLNNQIFDMQRGREKDVKMGGGGFVKNAAIRFSLK